MGYPATIGSPIRTHRLAIDEWLSELRVDYGTLGGVLSTPRNNVPILRVQASPGRILARVPELLIARGFIGTDQRPQASSLKVIPTPLASIDRPRYGDLSPSRSPQIPIQMGMQYQEGGAVYPQGFWRDASFTIRFWTQNESTMDFIQEWVMTQFGVDGFRNERKIMVRHGSPIPDMESPLFYEGFEDESELEGENAPVRRAALTVTLPSFFPRNIRT